MTEAVKRLIGYRIREGKSVQTMCEEIGITRMTFYRIKKGIKGSHTYTMELIDKYIAENGL